MLSFLRLRPLAALAAAALGLSALTGCGTTYQPARAAAFELDPAAHIDDDDIRKAFEARPQLSADLHVAYYCFDPAVARDLDAVLAGMPGVASVYRIPSLMVTGQRRLEEQSAWLPPREVTVKKLRLFAARAHADVLVVVDHGYRAGGVNGLAALNILLLPMLFTPFVDTTVDGYAEAFVIDVRNGYLYGHVSEDDKRGEEYARIYDKSARVLAAEQWETLRKAMASDLSRLVSEERARAKAATVAAVAPAAPAAKAADVVSKR
jgi:dihydroneopterin aldolase